MIHLFIKKRGYHYNYNNFKKIIYTFFIIKKDKKKLYIIQIQLICLSSNYIANTFDNNVLSNHYSTYIYSD